MDKIIRGILIIILPISIMLGCTGTTEFRKFNRSHLETYESGFRRAEGGSDILLEIYRFGGTILIPGAWGGYSLFIEGPPDIFQSNTFIEIPNNKVKAFYYGDYHHRLFLRKNIIGNINIIEVNDRFIEADINLKVDNTNINFTNAIFVRKNIFKYNKLEQGY